jgi:hypothetical protein
MRSSWALLVCVALGVTAVDVARAATFCVDTSAELRTALMTASTNSESDVIRIRTGMYATADGGAAFAYSTSQNFDLTLSGGWLPVAMFPCLLQSNALYATVLNGSGVRSVLRITPSAGTTGDITVENLTLRDGLAAESGGGLSFGLGGYMGDVVIDRVVFDRNEATLFGGGLSGSADGGTLSISNSLFLGNTCGSNFCAASITVNAASPTSVRALFGNNTIVGNACVGGAPGCTTGGVRYGGSARAAFYNNAFAFNGGIGLGIFSASLDLYGNNIVNYSGTPANMGFNLALTNPLFVDDASDDYRLRYDSPLRNAGTAGYPLGAIDLIGADRVNEFEPDIGAFENDEVTFRDSFETQI